MADLHPVVLYDGVCGFCDLGVRFLIARDPAGILRFAPLQGPYARGVLARHASLEGLDSMVLVEPLAEGGEKVSTRSAAAARTLARLGWPWRAALALLLIPRLLRDRAYDLFADRRYRLFGRFDACPIPSPAVRGRFLE